MFLTYDSGICFFCFHACLSFVFLMYASDVFFACLFLIFVLRMSVSHICPSLLFLIMFLIHAFHVSFSCMLLTCALNVGLSYM